MRTFNKPALPIGEQLRVLELRGLNIPSRDTALHYLEYIGYYRLSGYMIRHQLRGNGNDRHQFHPDTSIDEIVSDYVFDRKLRLLTMDAIERIEVAAKSTIFNHLSVKYGPHWYLYRKVFKDQTAYRQFETRISEVVNSRRKSQFIQHYTDTYISPPTPPSWMLAEELSLGAVSILFKGLKKREDQLPAARRFGAPTPEVMASWLHALSYCRNLCAHHSRVWNRAFTIKPRAKRDWASQLPEASKGRFYGSAYLMAYLLESISPQSDWVVRLVSLADNEPYVALQQGMGFPNDWRNSEIWRI